MGKCYRPDLGLWKWCPERVDSCPLGGASLLTLVLDWSLDMKQRRHIDSFIVQYIATIIKYWHDERRPTYQKALQVQYISIISEHRLHMLLMKFHDI